MRVGSVTKCCTIDKVENTFRLIKSYYEELGIEPKYLFEDTQGFRHLEYTAFSGGGSTISRHWFKYSDDNEELCGICYAESGTDRLIKFCEAKYSSCNILSTDLWEATNTDGSTDIVFKGKVIYDRADNIDVLSLGTIMHFFQIDKGLKREVLCVNRLLCSEHIYIPKTLDDFRQYYDSIIRRYGCEGYFDDVPLSSLFTIKDEIERVIFNNGGGNIV